MLTHISMIEVWHEVEMAVALSVGSWVMLFPVRTFIKRVVDAWNSQEDLLKEVHTELVTQRTNCLRTLQDQGKTQIDTLGRVADTLDGMHSQQAELTGYIKGLHDHYSRG